jgi:hypothetical protein
MARGKTCHSSAGSGATCNTYNRIQAQGSTIMEASMSIEMLQLWILFQVIVGLVCYKFLGYQGLVGAVAGATLYILGKILFGY